jgi:chaperone required for assembly of F1-ATPase
MSLTDADKLSRVRRFYSEVAAAPVDGGFGVLLDGRPAKTPGGAPLTAPTLMLAELLAGEWDRQATQIDFAAMPATRLAWTAIDRGAPVMPALAEEVARYASSDTLCHPAEGPRTLVQRQDALWGPWRDWAGQALGVRFDVAGGALHHRQPPETVQAVRQAAARLGAFELTGLAFASALYHSAILAFAVQRRALDAAQAFDISRLEEIYQSEQWGLDSEAAARIDALRLEAAMLDRWFAALV